MTKYAERTSVAPDRSRAEIENTLKRYGATGRMPPLLPARIDDGQS